MLINLIMSINLKLARSLGRLSMTQRVPISTCAKVFQTALLPPRRANALSSSARLAGKLLLRYLLLMIAVMVACILSSISAEAGSFKFAAAADYDQRFSKEFAKIISSIPQHRINSEPRQLALQGLEMIAENKVEQGAVLINSALRLDPSNSYLHLFNGFAYHLMAKRGDTQQYELAEQGYALAIKFDQSNWIAHYLMAALNFEQRKYAKAKSELAEVMLFNDSDPEVLSKMVAASYYSGDASTAAVCLNRLHDMDKNDMQVVRMLAIIHAALGRAEDANNWLTQYQASQPDALDLAATKERINHWNLVFRSAKNKAITSDTSGAVIDKADVNKMAQSNSSLYFDSKISSFGVGSEQGFKLLPIGFGPPIIPSSAVPMSGYNPGSNGPAPFQAQGPIPVAASNRMVLVDVVLMYTTDQLSSNKGVNLLHALTLQFGSDSSPFLTKSYAYAKDSPGTSILTRAITVPALTYSLNIVNSTTNVDEVLARPTLVALDGLKSEFFSGESLNAAAVSTGANGGNAVQIEKELGVKLGITPKFQDDGNILMAISAERTHLQPSSSDIGFTYKLSTTKLTLNANVVMKVGETLVLGGLSEKEITNSRSGVPVLQDVPGIQYLFSNKASNDYQHSVLMLITPRAPQYTSRSDEAIRADTNSGDDSMQELRARYGDWFSPYPNMASVFHQLGNSSIYREFRTGDVTLEKWDKQDSLLLRLKQALGFLYY